MIRMLFSSVMAIHGIIHLMGFAKEWDLGPTSQLNGKTLIDLSGNTSKFMGLLWLITCITLIGATALYVFRREWYWIPAAAAMLISQTLIIIYWQDAKLGTIVNVIILFAVILSAASLSFNKQAKREAENLISASSGNKFSITGDMIAELPPIIQTWLKKSQIPGREHPNVIHILQKGSLRSDANSDWMPFDAEQYFTIDPPGFVWKASIHTDAFIDIVGRDKYQNGKGNMLIKAASLIPMANSKGKEIDQGSMIRYMAEIIWFPHAAVSPFLDWKQIDSLHAMVTMRYGDVTASGIHTFNSDGFPIGFEAKRYGEFNGKYSQETWQVVTTGYRSFNGIPIGNTSEVTWKLKEGDFTWLRLQILNIEYK